MADFIDTYKVYVQTIENGCIIAVNSSAFLQDLTDWTLIDEGTGDKYHHAQGNYFPLPLICENGVYRYGLVDGVPVERTIEEMAADVVEVVPVPTQTEINAANIDYIMMMEGL